MKHVLSIAVAALCLAACATPSPIKKIPMTQTTMPNQMGVYVVSNDLERSGAFYTAIFGASPQIKTDTFMGFDVAGGLFAVVSKATYAPGASLGGNVVPYIKVPDINAAFAHVRAVAPGALASAEVIEEPYLSLFKFTDPDGNMLEYYALN